MAPSSVSLSSSSDCSPRFFVRLRSSKAAFTRITPAVPALSTAEDRRRFRTPESDLGKPPTPTASDNGHANSADVACCRCPSTRRVTATCIPARASAFVDFPACPVLPPPPDDFDFFCDRGFILPGGADLRTHARHRRSTRRPLTAAYTHTYASTHAHTHASKRARTHTQASKQARTHTPHASALSTYVHVAQMYDGMDRTSSGSNPTHAG